MKKTVYLNDRLDARLRELVPPRKLNRFINDVLEEKASQLEVKRLEEESLEGVEVALRARGLKAKLTPIVNLIVATGTCLVLWFASKYGCALLFLLLLVLVPFLLAPSSVGCPGSTASASACRKEPASSAIIKAVGWLCGQPTSTWLPSVSP